MIEYLVFVALHAAKASSTNIFRHVRLFSYLHVLWIEKSLAAQYISIALSYYSVKGVSNPVRRVPRYPSQKSRMLGLAVQQRVR